MSAPALFTIATAHLPSSHSAQDPRRPTSLLLPILRIGPAFLSSFLSLTMARVMRTVEIPIHEKDEVIEIELEKLPAAAEALEILKDVKARLHVWHTLAVSLLTFLHIAPFHPLTVIHLSLHP